jgi:Leucine-rich repeat (LRR) protein
MNDIPRDILKYTIKQYGNVIYQDQKKFKAILKDLCPEYKREINLLMSAIRERIVADLINISATQPIEILLVKLKQRLYNNLGVAQEFANWAVDSWALALGVISKVMITPPAKPPELKKPKEFINPKCTIAPSVQEYEDLISEDRKWWDDLDEKWKNIFTKAIGIKRTPKDNEILKIINLRALNCRANNISSLEPLSHLKNLQQLALQDNEISSLEPLKSLKHLRKLFCGNNNIDNLIALKQLKKLQYLSCWKNNITSLRAIKDLEDLRELDCSYNNITDLEPLSKLNELRELFCYYNPITSLKAISKLVSLQRLDCYNTNITKLVELKNLKNLQRLNCVNTKIANLEPLQNLTKLHYLNCNNTLISNLEPLRNLYNLQQLYCKKTKIKTLKPLRQLNYLQVLDCEETRVKKLEIKRFRKAVPQCHIYAKPIPSIWDQWFA